MMYLVMPVFLIVTFWGGFGTSIGGAVLGALKYVALLVVMILIRNTNPRLRIEHAVKFFWGPVTLLAVLAIILAFAGV
jgi:NADH-quinone oxidoreductase subunit H